MIEFFQKVVDILEKENIQYMLSGSLAMGIYVVPRATRDFDFIIKLSKDDVPAFAANFEKGFYCNKESIFEAIKYHSLFNIIEYESGFKADFVILKNKFTQSSF